MAKKTKKNIRKPKKSNPWMIATAALAVLLLASIFTGGFRLGVTTEKVIEDLNTLQEKTENPELRSALQEAEENLKQYTQVAQTDEKVKVDFYVMSQCPYGTQVEDAIYPVLEKLGENVDFNLNYISTDLGGGNFRSLHGEPETQGNIVQLCAAKYEPEKFMDMIICQNENARAIPGNWEECAKDNGLDVAKIKECYEGEEGKELLSESVLKAQEVSATGSPTIYINDQIYSGGRSERDFLVAICNQFDTRPQACSDIPVPKEIELIILNDANCPTCDTSQLVGALKQLFPGVKPRTVDVSSSEGKQLVKEFNVELAPAYIMGEAVVEEDAYKSNPNLQAAFEKFDDQYKIIDDATGATWFIDEDRRNEALEKIGVVKGDNTPQIDFYVMSYCPYGNQAEEAIKPVFDQLKDSAEFKPHYVVYNQGSECMTDEEGNKYCSLHGAQEMNQNIREQCVEKYYGIEEWFNFALAMNDACNSQNADTCWESVAQNLGYDTEKISTCEAEEGLDFVKKDYELNQLLGVRGSPTVFIEGMEYSGSRTADGYMASLCAGFEDAPEACDDIQVQTPQTAPSSGAGCGI